MRVGLPTGRDGRRFDRDAIYDATMNLATVVEGHRPDLAALIGADGVVTYGELQERIGRLRAALGAEGLRPGQRVCLLGANTEGFITTLFAALGCGLAVAPLDARNPRAETEREIAGIAPAAILAVDTVGGAAAAALTNTTVPVLSHASLVGSSLASPVGELVEGRDEEPALLMFTSGTAGLPKPAILSHRNLLSNLDQVDAHPAHIIDHGDVVLGVLPFTHILGLNSVLGYGFHVGASIVLSNDFAPSQVVETVRKYSVTTLIAPPVFWAALAATPDVESTAFAHVRLAASGAAPLPKSVGNTIEERFGLDIRQGYGLTEASPGLTLAVGTDSPRQSVGRPLPGIEMRLVDEGGDDVPIGDAGEILARGPNVFIGYLNEPEATAEAIDDDGWLHTGDLAVVDEEGHLFIVGRSKDLIIVSGFNVYPAEVEGVLRSHPAVRFAAAVGEPHDLRGEQVVAYVVAKAGVPVDVEEIEAHCRSQLAGYKCPRRVELVDALPRSSTGKVRRANLRKGS